MGIAREKPVRTMLGGFQSPGRMDQGIPEELAGAGEIAGVGEIASAMAIASVGVSI